MLDTTVLPLRAKFPIKRVLFLLITLCAALIALINLQIQIDSVSSRIKDLKQAKNSLLSNNQYLRREIDRGTSFDEIYPVVKEKFGMDFLSSEPVIIEVPENIIKNR